MSGYWQHERSRWDAEKQEPPPRRLVFADRPIPRFEGRYHVVLAPVRSLRYRWRWHVYQRKGLGLVAGTAPDAVASGRTRTYGAALAASEAAAAAHEERSHG